MTSSSTTVIFWLFFAFFALPANAGAANYYVGESGDDSNPGTAAAPFRTIQKAATLMRAGDTAIVQPGNYGRAATARVADNVPISGAPGNPITFKGLPGAISNGFYIYGDHFKIDGFTFTGDFPPGAGSFMVHSAGDYVEVANNTFTGTFTTLSLGMIRLGGSHSLAHHNVIKDWVNATSEATAIQVQGGHNVIEYNRIQNASDIDVFEAFGHDNIIRYNSVINVTDGPIGTHIDFLQVFGNNGEISYNLTVDHNLVDGLAGQIAQLEQGCGPSASPNNCTLVPEVAGAVTAITVNSITDSSKSWIAQKWAPSETRGYTITVTSGRALGKVYVIASNTSNVLTLINNDGTTPSVLADGVEIGDTYELRNRIGWWTFTNNVFANIQLGLSGSLPHLVFKNNTYYNTLIAFSGGSAGRGRAVYGQMIANVFLQQPRYVPYGHANDVSKQTFLGDYNFAANIGDFSRKSDSHCTEEYAQFEFCEQIWPGKHGINGGGPMFRDPTNPLGPDGLAFTPDDGLKPRPGSPLCDRGPNRSDIGAYSCGDDSVPPSTPSSLSVQL
jgi:hypothetical protein